MNLVQEVVDESTAILYGGDRKWFDVHEKDFVRMTTLYVPYGNERGGCPDWRGAWKGTDITKMPCVFCALPNAVKEYQQAFYDGAPVPHEEIVAKLMHNIAVAGRESDMHTLAIFNGGSFLAMEPDLQLKIVACVVAAKVQRLVIESRAELVTDDAVARIMRELAPYDIKLTVRIGVETQDDKVRMHVLRKGHVRKTLIRAVQILHAHGVTVGGYALVAPAPHSWILRVHPQVQNYELWALDEGVATVHAILDEFDMDEVYVCSTCVAPGTYLEKLWQEGAYEPASLTLIAEVLAKTVVTNNKKPIHLLPLKDEPAFVAVSSNHSRSGVHQNETKLHKHDRQFRALLDFYRATMEIRPFLRAHQLLRHDVHDCTLCQLLID